MLVIPAPLEASQVAGKHHAKLRQIAARFRRYCAKQIAQEVCWMAILVAWGYAGRAFETNAGMAALGAALLSGALSLLRAANLLKMRSEGRDGARVINMNNTISCARSMPFLRRMAFMSEMRASAFLLAATVIAVFFIVPLLVLAYLTTLGVDGDLDHVTMLSAVVLHSLMAALLVRRTSRMYNDAVLDSVDRVLKSSGAKSAFATSACNERVNRELMRIHKREPELTVSEGEGAIGVSARSWSASVCMPSGGGGTSSGNSKAARKAKKRQAGSRKPRQTESERERARRLAEKIESGHEV